MRFLLLSPCSHKGSIAETSEFCNHYLPINYNCIEKIFDAIVHISIPENTAGCCINSIKTVQFVGESERIDRYLDMMKEFAKMVTGEKQNPYTPDYELELYKTIKLCCGEE